MSRILTIRSTAGDHIGSMRPRGAENLHLLLRSSEPLNGLEHLRRRRTVRLELTVRLHGHQDHLFFPAADGILTHLRGECISARILPESAPTREQMNEAILDLCAILTAHGISYP